MSSDMEAEDAASGGAQKAAGTGGGLFKACEAASPHRQLSSDQERGLRLVCGGGDGLVLIRTGGGKSLLWQLPAMQGDELTLVVVPTRALALDLKESCDNLLKGTGKYCVFDERSDGGERVEPDKPASSEAASAAAVIGREGGDVSRSPHVGRNQP